MPIIVVLWFGLQGLRWKSKRFNEETWRSTLDLRQEGRHERLVFCFFSYALETYIATESCFLLSSYETVLLWCSDLLPFRGGWKMAGSTDDESKPGAREGSVLFQTFIHLMCMCLSTASLSLWLWYPCCYERFTSIKEAELMRLLAKRTTQALLWRYSKTLKIHVTARCRYQEESAQPLCNHLA